MPDSLIHTLARRIRTHLQRRRLLRQQAELERRIRETHAEAPLKPLNQEVFLSETLPPLSIELARVRAQLAATVTLRPVLAQATRLGA